MYEEMLQQLIRPVRYSYTGKFKKHF